MRVYGSMMALFLLVVPSVVVAQNMPVSTFLAKTEALKAKGMMAMFSSDVAALQAEMKAAAIAYRASPMSKRPQSCPPEPGKGKLGSDELIAAFQKVPAAQRASTRVSTAFSDMMVKRYPCK